MTSRFVIDTDPGIDDALALLLAARASAARLGAVAVTYGNTTLDRAARNARLVLARAPSDAPVFAGWDRPLRRSLVTAKETHGPEGLGVHFEIDLQSRTISACFTPRDVHEGFEGVVHGGILSALLDEAMAKLTVALGIPAMTAEMTVKFKASTAPGEELLITGRLVEETRRLIRAEALIERGPVIVAEATGKLIRI